MGILSWQTVEARTQCEAQIVWRYFAPSPRRCRAASGRSQSSQMATHPRLEQGSGPRGLARHATEWASNGVFACYALMHSQRIATGKVENLAAVLKLAASRRVPMSSEALHTASWLRPECAPLTCR